MANAKVRVRVLIGHSTDCYALANARKGTWSTPWFIDSGALRDPVEYRDALGRETRHGHRRWLRVRCNCTTCPAVALVHESDLLTVLLTPTGESRA